MVMKESTIKKHLTEALIELQSDCEPKQQILTNYIAKDAILTDCLDKCKNELALSQQHLSEITQCLVYELERLENTPDSKWSKSMVDQYCEELKSCIEVHDKHPAIITKLTDLASRNMAGIISFVIEKDHETMCAKNPLIMGIMRMFLSKDSNTWWIHGNYAVLRFGLESWESCGDDKYAYYYPTVHFPMIKKGKVNPREITFHFLKVVKTKLHNNTGKIQLEISLVNIRTDVYLDFNFIMHSDIHQNSIMDKELLHYLIQSETSNIYLIDDCNCRNIAKPFYAFLDNLDKKEE